ncbi:MAG: head GIN domain-containing protein [Flavobacteriales bacterium]
MKILPVLVIACAGYFIYASSYPNDCVKGTGEPVKKDLSVAPFHGVEVMGSLDVELTQAATQSVVVEGQANLAELVETTVDKGIWTIKTSKCYSTDKPFVVRISVPAMDRVAVMGSGDVTSKNAFGGDAVDIDIQGSGDVTMTFNCKSVDASVQGSGDIKLGGECQESVFSVQGSGDVKAIELKSQRAMATVTGSGDIAVQVSESLNASVTGSGSVKYKGKPTDVKQNVTGSGDVVEIK